MDSALTGAVLAGIAAAAVTGPLGAFVVWRRMAFFGGAIGHAALLGVGLGLVFDFNVMAGAFAVCIALGLVLSGLLDRLRDQTADTLLLVLAHATLALGLVVVTVFGRGDADLEGLLFGDILDVGGRELALIYGGAAVVLLVLARIWRPLLSVTVNAELARIEGVRVGLVNAVFMVLVAAVVAASLKIMGVLLVASLLGIPAAAARKFARTPEQMAGIAALIGAISVIAGTMAANLIGAPAGPSIVVVASALFVAASLVPVARRTR